MGLNRRDRPPPFQTARLDARKVHAFAGVFYLENTMSRNVNIVRTLDHDNAAIVLVPLARGGTAKLLASGYDHLRGRGLSECWTSNSNGRSNSYVRASQAGATGGLITVARAVAGAGRGQCVRYRDGNRLNLRNDNLYFAPRKRAWRDDAALLAPPVRSHSDNPKAASGEVLPAVLTI